MGRRHRSQIPRRERMVHPTPQLETQARRTRHRLYRRERHHHPLRRGKDTLDTHIHTARTGRRCRKTAEHPRGGRSIHSLLQEREPPTAIRHHIRNRNTRHHTHHPARRRGFHHDRHLRRRLRRTTPQTQQHLLPSLTIYGVQVDVSTMEIAD